MSIFLMMMAVFLVFVFLGIPVSFSIGLSTVAAVLAKGMPLAFVSQMAFTGLDSYTCLLYTSNTCQHPGSSGQGRGLL